MKIYLKYAVLAAACALCFLSGCGREAGTGSLKDSLGEPIQTGEGGEPQGVDGDGTGFGEVGGFADTGMEKPNGLGDTAEGSNSAEGNSPAMGNSPAQGTSAEDANRDHPAALLDKTGMTLETRVKTPPEYERIAVEEGSFARYLRSFPVKELGAKVHLYDGSEKADQSGHASVFDLPIENYDLQQCADTVMRVYAEYFWSSGQTDRIAFHFTNGFLAEYTKWRDGMRIRVSGNDVSWVSSGEYDDSYDCFVQYLRMVFCYAGTLSMSGESKDITMEELRPGDVFLHGGSPGHVVMVMDVCENAEGKKAFLLGQGYMPAQEFHLLKNGLHEEDPWYYEEELEYPLRTPGYTFQEGSLKRLLY